MGARGVALQPSLCSDPLSRSTEAMRLGPASGLLVDWLETLDPEVVCSCPDLQWKLLFSRRKVTGTWPGALPQCCHSRLCLVASRGVGLARPGLPVPGSEWCMSLWGWNGVRQDSSTEPKVWGTQVGPGMWEMREGIGCALSFKPSPCPGQERRWPGP